MCFTSETDTCEWQKKGFKIDIWEKLRTDEWQLCSDQSAWDATNGGDPCLYPDGYICATRYPGNVKVRLEDPNAVSMEDSPFEAYKTKTTVRPTHFFLSFDDLLEFNKTCPVERNLTGSEVCTGSYNNAFFQQFPPFEKTICQCKALGIPEENKSGEETVINVNYNMNYEKVTQTNKTFTMENDSTSPCMFKF